MAFCQINIKEGPVSVSRIEAKVTCPNDYQLKKHLCNDHMALLHKGIYAKLACWANPNLVELSSCLHRPPVEANSSTCLIHKYSTAH